MTTDIKHLRKLLAAATPGAWRVFGKETGVVGRYESDAVGSVEVGKVGDYRDKELLPYNRERWDADAALIVEARNALPGLLDEVERLRAGLKDALHALTLVTERDGLLDDESDYEQRAHAALAGDKP